MRFYWTLKHVPEMSGLSREDRLRVHRACYRKHVLKSPHCIVALVVCGLCGGPGAAAGGLSHFVLSVPPSIWQPALGAAIGGGIGGVIFGQTFTSYLRPIYADYIKRELRRD